MKLNSESIKKIAETIKSIGHPSRVEILFLLNKNGQKMSVTEIYETLELTQPETSRHLAVLKNSSVLKCEKEGSNSYYSINDDLFFISCIINCFSKYDSNNISDK